MPSDNELSTRVVELLRGAKQTVSVAESLTGGKLGALITHVPGASDVFVGGVLAYQKRAKVKLLSIDPILIDSFGVVSEEVAIAMADGVRSALGSTWALATTGVAGPGASDGMPAGSVWLALRGPSSQTMKLSLAGDRESVRNAAVSNALTLFERILSHETREAR